ncbi:MAG: ABC exporter membrane fusion protein [Chlorogloeopsis fritschii C42_A2020_084]|uniref:ABC exporter membrane fusion protein n=1 Tax=Chlorogloeopsis fritschii TaxID=1124 RepID=UPI0019FB8D5F|nr:ABC exporter membrane fusion protein [Chlorogloeopsis fritschii]MBF2009389.1 ABC exporter membrane fusion protein [Chlorogloeopsis fritschii C42_A2020_084]
MSADKRSFLFVKPASKWPIFLAAFIALTTGLVSFFSLLLFRSNVQTQPQKPVKAAPARVAVTALGRIVPDGEVTQLSAPSSLTGVRVEKLLVKEGEKVKAGQVVALLEGYARSLANVQQALSNVDVAQAKLAQVKAGAKTGDINAQKAAIARIESQLQGDIAAQKAAIASLQAQADNAQTENSRYQQLYREGAVSASTAASKALQYQTVQQQLIEAKATLNRTVDTLEEQLSEARAKLGSIKEVRPTDVQLAQAELKSAISAVKQAKAEHDLTYVKAPIDGKVLKAHAKSGEVVATAGIVEIGKTSQMSVIAEVYQTDIQKVRPGQKAVITSTAFSKKLQGTVSEIGLLVDRQSILSINPGADTDRRVIQVKIRIDNPADSELVAGLTNLQVDVAIKI